MAAPKELYGRPYGGVNAPSKRWALVTPSNTVNFEYYPRAIYIAGAGNVALVADDDTVMTLTGVTAFTCIPVSPKRVNATGTSATVYALY